MLILQCFLFFCVGSVFAEHCGETPIQPNLNRVVGGHAAVQGSWPFVVMLIEDGRQACGGSLLNQHYVLTAAHCFDKISDRVPSKWKIAVGKHHLFKSDQAEQVEHVHTITMHPSYNITTVENDLALLKLTHPVHYNSHIQPMCLPNSGHTLHTNQQCMTAGWGETRGTGDATVLNQVVIPILSSSDCERPDWYGSDFLKQTMICAGYEQGAHDTCNGDSGGPLMCKYGNYWYQQGITSWGIDCAQPKQPGVYTKLSNYVSWIEGVMLSGGHPYSYTFN